MYRTVETDFWDDPKFNELGRDVLCLALYLVTNPDSHTTGIYRFRPSLACERMQMPQEQFRVAFDRLIELGFCKWDPDRRIVWVVNMFKRQPHDGLHINRLPGHFKTLYDSPLINEFLDKYPKCQDMHKAGTKLSQTRHKTGTNLHKSALQKKEKEKEKENIPDSGESRVSPSSQVYNFYINQRRLALNRDDWKPTKTQAEQMRTNIKKLLEADAPTTIISWLTNYFADDWPGSKMWPWTLFMRDPIQWSIKVKSRKSEEHPFVDPEAKERRRIMDEKKVAREALQKESQN